MAGPVLGSPSDSNFDPLLPEAYQKIYITQSQGTVSADAAIRNANSTLSGMLEEDILIASKHLMKALLLRKRYAAFAMHSYPHCTTKVLENYDSLFPSDSKPLTLAMAAIEALERPNESTRKASVQDFPVNPTTKASKYDGLSAAELEHTPPPSPLINTPPVAAADTRLFGNFAFCMNAGVLQVYERREGGDGEQLVKLPFDAGLPSFSEYMTHLRKLTRYTADGPLKVRASLWKHKHAVARRDEMR